MISAKLKCKSSEFSVLSTEQRVCPGSMALVLGINYVALCIGFGLKGYSLDCTFTDEARLLVCICCQINLLQHCSWTPTNRWEC